MDLRGATKLQIHKGDSVNEIEGFNTATKYGPRRRGVGGNYDREVVELRRSGSGV